MRILGYRPLVRFEPVIDNIHLRSIDELHNLDTWHDQILLRIWRKAERHDAMADSPWHFVYRKLVEWYPDAKFILTLRKDANAVAESEFFHNLNHGMPKKMIPKPGFFIERYEKHNKYVRDFFKGRANYTEMMIEHMNWADLCSFLEIDEVPQRAFPWKNKGKRP
jgi:hypothetical protein